MIAFKRQAVIEYKAASASIVIDIVIIYPVSSVRILKPLQRYGIVATRTERLTTAYPRKGKQASYKKATVSIRVYRVGRACRLEPACRFSFQRGQIFLIKAYQKYAEFFHTLLLGGALAPVSIISVFLNANLSSRAMS